MITPLRLDGRLVWFKQYPPGSSRRFRLAALDRFARLLRLAPLRPPPRHRAANARQVEERRLQALAGLQVRVPQVIASAESALLLSDLGPTLAMRLRTADIRQADRLVQATVAAMARTHDRGGYLGQPLARNIAVDDQGQIGFLDFEEDPAEVMSLPDAQARDWLLFVAGSARHYPGDAEHLAALLRPAIQTHRPVVIRRIDQVTSRLGMLERWAACFGSRAAGIGKALRALRHATWLWAWLALALVLVVDLANGELELAGVLTELLY